MFRLAGGSFSLRISAFRLAWGLFSSRISPFNVAWGLFSSRISAFNVAWGLFSRLGAEDPAPVRIGPESRSCRLRPKMVENGRFGRSNGRFWATPAGSDFQGPPVGGLESRLGPIFIEDFSV